ncbi:GNAT family N-acetyltransferase [Propionimicrobium sp. PCR01-08-3]|uniref:GNAT family N-acetyltransferase n=1 Tax=Propionimicrobium sp. PCR01-08-3 TaxID=3052086 RepID=UPI00255C2A05|nr:GNAT family N-acetyltransferase [Propionimicrobium sp. PCR01-08-3]WIY82492.1 GNAT family N-acetyltransferase [Propionimicrobium sp. PCR01-08-3]
MANLEFRNNEAGFRYEALEGGELVSQIDYTVDGDVMTFTHTGTPPQHRGRQLADKLTRWALDDVRARGRKIVPLCPFTASFVSQHSPDYDDIVVQRLH